MDDEVLMRVVHRGAHIAEEVSRSSRRGALGRSTSSMGTPSTYSITGTRVV